MTVRGGGPPRRLVGRDGGNGRPELDPEHYATGEWDPAEDGAFDDVRGDAYRPRAEYRLGRTSGARHVSGFLLFALVLAALVIGGLWFGVRPAVVRGVADWAAENDTALQLPFVADIVRGELGSSLTDPAGTSDQEVTVVILEGETPRQIGADLAAKHLIKDARAFVFLSIEENASSSFVAGKHTLKATMTPDEIIRVLQQAPPAIPTVTVTFREGLRIEQMVAKLELVEQQPDDPQHPLKLNLKDFYDEATKPPAALLTDYPWLPKNRSLEGFLYPATYTLPLTATADQLIRELLDAFAKNAPPELLKEPPDKLYATVKLASIVETEAKLDSERPLIAGVYQNRLNGGARYPWKTLAADPTLNYANDTIQLAKLPFGQWVNYTFWKRLDVPSLSKVAFPKDLSSYQTYVNPGLPAAPICSPSLKSIQAALAPNTAAGYYYFVLIPGTDQHDFSKTLAEHQQKLAKYGYNQ